MFTGSMGKIALFCSYAREDEALRARLETVLAPLRAEHIIDDWYDNRIMPGQRWNGEIEAALQRARIMLFIVTPDLLASRYVAETEIPRAMERELSGLCQVVPVMARQADWSASPLARFQALPGNGKWLDELGNSDAALALIQTGLREVCKRVVDWENPYKRSQPGDWTHFEQTMTLDDGRAITLAGTEELVGKTATEATVLVEVDMGARVEQKTVTMDLTRPLEDRMGDMLRQTGTELPANLEIVLGPAQYADEALHLGGTRYETIRARRSLSLTQRGQSFSGSITTWRSIDIPLFGTVKGESRLPGFSQNQILLGYGHGDAATRKPRFGASRSRGGGQFPPPPPPPAVGPGRWLVHMNAYGMPASFDLLLYPNGALQGQQTQALMPVQLQGQWFYDPARQTLAFQFTTFMAGLPSGQDAVQMQITGTNGVQLFAVDTLGRQFQLQRVA